MQVLEGLQHPGVQFYAETLIYGPRITYPFDQLRNGVEKELFPLFGPEVGVSQYIYVSAHPYCRIVMHLWEEGNHLGVGYWLFQPSNNIIYIY